MRSVHGVFAWLPARVLIFTYAMAGSFDGAIGAWRGYLRKNEDEFFRATNDVLGCVGDGAAGGLPEDLSSTDLDYPTVANYVGLAMDLVSRTLWLVWCPAIAIMTLTDLLS